MFAKAIGAIVIALSFALAHAAYDQGRDAYQRGDYERALRELVPAGDSDARAASILADIYGRGLGTRADAQQSLLWLRRAGELGDVQAQVRLGAYYAQESAQDRREALEWYRRAAEQGSPEAQYAVGRMLVEGQGVPPDAVEAVRWIQGAAEGGVLEAADWLANAYEQGTAVIPDPQKAAHWRQRAGPPRLAQIPPPGALQDIAEQTPSHPYSCSDPDTYGCEQSRRERNWRLHYGFGWYSGDPWYWGAPLGPSWGPAWAWGWGPRWGSGSSFGFSWGF